MRTLKPHEIEVRVGTISKNKPKAMLLLYKDARCDMAVLDETYGGGLWQSKYERIDGVLFCSIGVYNETIKEWVWKSSNGIESQGTGVDDPNNKKGEASDAFKRAGFMWGIGRELYEWKGIWIDYDKVKDKYTTYRVTEISYNDKGEPQNLKIVGKGNKVVFNYKDRFNTKKSSSEPKNDVKQENDNEIDEETVLNDVQQQNHDIYKDILFEAHKILNNKVLAKNLTKEYFKDIIKIPFKKMELTYEEQTKSLPNLVVVTIDDKWLLNFRNYISNKVDKKNDIF